MKQLMIVIFAAMVIAWSGCTDNGGDTGKWGGTWHLEQIEQDGVTDQAYAGNVFWKFQADVIDMVETDDEMHERQDHFGTWSVSDDERVLAIDYGHSSDRYPAGSAYYVPPKVTGLRGGITHLDVVLLTGKEMRLKWPDPESGVERTFVLRKQ